MASNRRTTVLARDPSSRTTTNDEPPARPSRLSQGDDRDSTDPASFGPLSWNTSASPTWLPQSGQPQNHNQLDQSYGLAPDDIPMDSDDPWNDQDIFDPPGYHRSPFQTSAPIAISNGTSPIHYDDHLDTDDYFPEQGATLESGHSILPRHGAPIPSSIWLRSARSFADLRPFHSSPSNQAPLGPISIDSFPDDGHTGSDFDIFDSPDASLVRDSSRLGGGTRSSRRSIGRTRRQFDAQEMDIETVASPRDRHVQYSSQLVESMNQKSLAPPGSTASSPSDSMDLEDSLKTTDMQYKFLMSHSVANDALKQVAFSSTSGTDFRSNSTGSREDQGPQMTSATQTSIIEPQSGTQASSSTTGAGLPAARRPLRDCYDAAMLLKSNLHFAGGTYLSVLCNEQSRQSTISIQVLECSHLLDIISTFEPKLASLLDATQESNMEGVQEVSPVATQLVDDIDKIFRAFWDNFARAGLDMSSWMPYFGASYTETPSGALFVGISRRAELWLFTLQMIDLMLLCHNSSHIVDFKAHFGWDPQDDDWYPYVPSLASKENVPVLRHRTLACLGGMLDNTPVWVLQTAKDSTEGNCLVSCTANEIAVTWGDVYGAQGDNHDGFESFRIPLGFILPWTPTRSDSSKLVDEERYCHWVPEIAYLARKQGHLRALSKYGPWRPDKSARPLKTTDRMLIGMEPLPSMHLKQCDHNHIAVDDAFFKDSLERDLGTLPSRTWWDPTFQLAGGFHVTATLIGKRQREQITQKQALIDKWALDENWGNPRDLESMWGVMVSRCTLNAKRVRIRDLLKTPTMRYEIDDCRWTVPGLKKRFIEAVLSPDEKAIVTLWEHRHDDVRRELRRVILSLLRTLAQSGISRKENNSSDTDRFDMLWRPDAESRMKVATINAGSHPWVTFLRDRHYSSCMAVMVEEEIRLSGRFHHGRHSYRSLKPSALETVIRMTQPPTQLQCAYYLLDTRGTVEHPPWPVHRNWVYALKFGPTPPGFALELKSGKLRVERALGDWYLVTRWKESKARQAAQSLGFNLEEKRDVCEELERFDRAQLRPVPVHITGGLGWYEERHRAG